MTHREQIRGFLSDKKPLVVGAVADLQSLSAPSSGCDIIELRLDSLGTGSELLDFAKNSPLPLLITARGAAEGGQSDWQIEERAEAYRTFLPHAALIDIELRDFGQLQTVIADARESGTTLIGSFHNFDKTPSLESLIEKSKPEADLLKFALMVNSNDDIKTHLSLLDSIPGRDLSVMGMGPLGAAARPLMAKAGSLLNYGFIGNTPTAPNQWPASLLGEALSV